MRITQLIRTYRFDSEYYNVTHYRESNNYKE